MKHLKTLAFAGMVFAAGTAIAQETTSPEGAELYFINIEDGGTVSSPVRIKFGLRAMGVAPAGVEKENTGHHHLLINRAPFGQGEYGEEEYELAVPNDDNHRHFGGGQTEVQIDLPAGTHTLQLVLGDAGHVPHNPPVVSKVITVTVD